jgi:hypothetical protein
MTKVALSPVDLKIAATRRALARRTLSDADYDTYPDVRTGVKFRVQKRDPQFKKPADLGEWVDDQQCRCPARTWVGDYLIVLYESFRHGQAAALAMVEDARRLHLHDAYGAWMALKAATSDLAEVADLLRVVRAAWEQAGLQRDRPAAWSHRGETGRYLTNYDAPGELFSPSVPESMKETG